MNAGFSMIDLFVTPIVESGTKRLEMGLQAAIDRGAVDRSMILREWEKGEKILINSHDLAEIARAVGTRTSHVDEEVFLLIQHTVDRIMPLSISLKVDGTGRFYVAV